MAFNNNFDPISIGAVPVNQPDPNFDPIMNGGIPFPSNKPSEQLTPDIIKQNVLKLQNSNATLNDIDAYVKAATSEMNNTSTPLTPSNGTVPPAFPASPDDNPIVAGGKSLGNVVPSAVNLVGGLAHAVVHPIETLKGIGNLIKGSGEEIGKVLINHTPVGDIKTPNGSTMKQNLQNLSPDQANKVYDAFKNALVDRYGSLDKARISATNDPIGVGTDIFTILEGGAGLADSAVGAGIDTSKLTGQALIDAQKANAPVTSAINNTLTKVTAPATSLVKGTLGLAPKLAGGTLGFTTGTGYDTLKAGYDASVEGGEASKAFLDGLRNKMNPDDLVNKARESLSQIVADRSQNYSQQLASLKGNTKTFDISPVLDTFNTNLEKYGVGIKSDGTFDFSRSPGLGRYQTDIQQMQDMLKNWGSKPGDRTIVGIDKLKQTLDDFRIGSNDSGRFDSLVSNLRNSAKGIIINEPGYKQMLSDWENSTGLIKDIQQGLSLGDRANVDTSFQKLISSLKGNNPMRQQLMQELNQVAGGSLMPSIAGEQMKTMLPRGLVKYMEGLEGAYAFVKGTGVPQILALATATSPRIVGEFIHSLGFGARQANKLIDIFNRVSMPTTLGTNALNRFVPQPNVPQENPQ